jgi:PD-(D/E)XK nuclease superfamily
MGLEFIADTHTYLLDGQKVQSVTGILKASGLIDFSKIPPFILEKARDRGSIVHAAIHAALDRDLDRASFDRDFPEYVPYLDAWSAFCEQRRFVPVLTEHRLASRRLRVAGTLDSLGLLDGSPVLLDWKSGRAEDCAADLQLAGYHGLALEWASEDAALAAFFHDHPVVKRYAVQLRKDGTFRVEAYTDVADFRKFKVLVEAQQIIAAHRGSWIELAEVA